MPLLGRSIGVAVDLAGCPNRCRHCCLGCGPNLRLKPEALRWVAEAFRACTGPGEHTPYFDRVAVASWYREPDYAEDYKALYDLEAELSRGTPRRYELLSAWRLARDPGYAPWARERGPRTCQLTFFGTEDTTDHFFRRPGAFADNLAATERLLEAEMIPRWQIILTKSGLDSLADLMSVAADLNLRERVAKVGGEFDIFCHPPSPDGEAWEIENLRVDQADLARIPGELMEATRKHFRGTVNWQPEAELVARALGGDPVPAYVPEETWFFVNSRYDIFSNYGELTPAWRLGNLMRNRVSAVVDAFETAATPGLRGAFHVPDAELAERFGRRDSRALYSPSDAKARWVHLFCEERLSRTAD